ncbi:MAG: PAS domain-containing protein, partial [Gammaproteobacteria bacterium]|nr:PAS domain-containing protein [Gammaproteobacteria bacterium]
MSQQQSAELLQAFNQFNQVSDALDKSFELLNETVSNFQQDIHASQDPQDSPAMSQHLRELVDAIPGAVIVLNANGQVVDFNIAARELLGDLQAEAYWRDIVGRSFLPELDQGELRTPDGRQFSISTRPLGYQPGQILLLSDVTQTRQLQRAAQQNLHLMTMGKMMASLAHQIRTPLSSTMLY